RDAAALHRALRGATNAGVTVGSLHVGAKGGRSVAVVAGGKEVGRVNVAVPLNRGLLRSLSGTFPPGDLLLFDGNPLPHGYRTMSGGPFVALTPQHPIDAAAHRSQEIVAGVLLALLVAMGLATYLLGSSIVRALRRLADGAQALAGGDLRRRVPV